MTASARNLDHPTARRRPTASAVAARYDWPPPAGQLDTTGSDDRGEPGTVTLRCASGVTVRSAGVDLADERRLGLALVRRGPDIVRRIFTGSERAAVCTDPQARLAELTAMFGVKESVVKILGGLPPGSRYQDIVVEPLSADHLSCVHLGGVLADWAERRDVTLVAAAVPVADRLTLAWAAALTGTAHR